MGCLLAPLALISPRPVLVLLWILSNVLSRAFDSWIIPLLGFFVLPWTTAGLCRVLGLGPATPRDRVEWFFAALAFFIDLGAYAGVAR